MANLSINRGNGDKPSAIQSRDWEPMRALQEFVPLGILCSNDAELGRPRSGKLRSRFRDQGNERQFPIQGGRAWTINEADLDIRLTQNRLTVSGKRELEKVRQERDVLRLRDEHTSLFTPLILTLPGRDRHLIA